MEETDKNLNDCEDDDATEDKFEPPLHTCPVCLYLPDCHNGRTLYQIFYTRASLCGGDTKKIGRDCTPVRAGEASWRHATMAVWQACSMFARRCPSTPHLHEAIVALTLEHTECRIAACQPLAKNVVMLNIM